MKSFSIIVFAVVCILVPGCRQEDYGPQQTDKRSFFITGFDRLEASDGFDVTVQQGPVFSVAASGDRRDLDDLAVSKIGNTLKMSYSASKHRQYTVFITVTMPVVTGIDLSGAVNARLSGFADSTARFDASLSGASAGQFQINAAAVHIFLTGASEGHFSGTGTKIDASVSGASELMASDYAVNQAELLVTGASKASVNAAVSLTVSASGASEVVYSGDPQIDSDASGGSTVRKE